MSVHYRTLAGDVLDRICWRHYGHESAIVDVLDSNPHLAELGPELPAGLLIELPDLPDTADTTCVVHLWD